MTASAPPSAQAVEAVFDRFHADHHAPGVAYGVVVDGALVHTGSRGTIRADGDAAPDAMTRYRIASMTKSFTAAAILRLRDDGRLGLDDEVTAWVPELAPPTGLTRDAAPITIRSLLTMSSGLPTDDPWGDRLLGQDPDAFLRFLAGGPRLAWDPGTHYEYANAGFAILGQIVGRASGEGYRRFVERRVLEPLGLTRTSYDVVGVEPAEVAPGYVRRADAWVEEPLAPDGAFAPMGGLFSTVTDLATWVSTFLFASPPRDDPDPAVPIARASLREMQQLHRSIPPEVRWTSAGAPPTAFVSGYGYGLFVIEDVVRGRIVTHSGGLPGHGSNMRWHPATGLGVVAAANGRYAPLGLACREALNALVDDGTRPRRRPRPWPETAAARDAVDRLIEAWDDELAERLFADNIDLDEPLSLRRAAIEALRDVHGALRPEEGASPVSHTPAHLRWTLVGDRGRVEVEILLTPERPPRVQWLELTSIPEPRGSLVAIAGRVVALLGEDRPRWPVDLPLGPDVEQPALERDLRATDALFGPLALAEATAGDGEGRASWRLNGPRGDVTLSIELAADGTTIQAISLVPDAHESPVEPA